MKIKMKQFITLLAIWTATCFMGCATFSKKNFKTELEKLNSETVSKINGSYSLTPVKVYYDHNRKKNKYYTPDSLAYNNGYRFMLNQKYKHNAAFDTIRKTENNYRLQLQIENTNLLHIKVFENAILVKDTFLLGKYKRGMFYLNNKYIKCTGIPYLFGGCNNNKRRVGITKKGNLLINEAVDNSGALLFFLWAGQSYNLTYEYERKF
jgi:hypothetical protein